MANLLDMPAHIVQMIVNAPGETKRGLCEAFHENPQLRAVFEIGRVPVAVAAKAAAALAAGPLADWATRQAAADLAEYGIEDGYLPLDYAEQTITVTPTVTDNDLLSFTVAFSSWTRVDTYEPLFSAIAYEPNGTTHAFSWDTATNKFVQGAAVAVTALNTGTWTFRVFIGWDDGTNVVPVGLAYDTAAVTYVAP